MRPQVGHYFGGRVDAVGRNHIAGERRTRNDFPSGGVGGARGVAEPFAGGQRIVDRDQRSRAVADVGEIAGALRIGRDGVGIRGALA